MVFCFYAEDAGLFGAKDAFSRYILQYKPGDIRGKLVELFKALDTPIKERADMYLPEEVEAFPYVNGGLFSDENIVIPKITQELKDTLAEAAKLKITQELKDTLAEAAKFDWSKISPTIFGAVFESTLNPETRRAGGMHYTSIENIHKVIDPLFLDELREELDEIKKIQVPGTQKKKLKEYQKKLAGLVFFDPACGSGNFLTETYLSLRRIENEVLQLIVAADSKTMTGQITFGFEEDSPIQVSIHQFYGIEINDFAVSVAQTALWIAESQTMKETEDIVHQSLDFFPLKTYKGITEGNALQIDWQKVVPLEKLSYIMGNPPFVGHKNMSPEQKTDMKRLFNNRQGRLDYVSAWYLLAAQMIQGTKIECSFVSTNTVVQGIHIETLWATLTKEYNIHINFAYTTFRWMSEAKDKASVFCVIIGFSEVERKKKTLFDSDLKTDTCIEIETDYISPYLTAGEDIIVSSRNKPVSDVSKMIYGNIPRDGGNYTFTDEEKDEFLKIEPKAKPYMFKFLGSKEFINGTQRWILFLRDCPPNELKKMPHVVERINKVREFRLSSKAKEIHKFAETPTLFAQQTQPIGKDFVLVPIVSSSRRRYIPMAYVSGDVLVNNRVFVVPEATLYEFGVLSSNVHNSWMRRVAVRLKDDYSYSKDLVYNTFVWPSPTLEQKEKIEKTAQGILDARALYPDSSLADLYDPLTMPPELRKAHQLNDKAVMQAYGMPIKETDEAACVAWLMKLYQEKVNNME